ncbi:MAG: alpha-ketoacid dehydrogenase subunit beta [Chloroflexota bacterium]
MSEERILMVRDAIREGLMHEMRRDPRVFLLGEDIIDPWGGSWKTMEGCYTEFGPERVRETPISEEGIVSCAVGAALLGMRPVAEIMFSDFVTRCMDSLVNQAAKLRYMTGGQASVPMVVRTASGAGRAAAAQHSQSLEAWFTHVPGIKVVAPSTPYDAKGLILGAIRDPDPVLFLEHKMNFATKGPVPEEDYVIPLGKSDVKRQGKDLTLVATSRQVIRALEAAEQVAKEDGTDVEVVDPRTLFPLDFATIHESIKKTGRVLIVSEGVERGGYGDFLVARIMAKAFYDLDAPVLQVAAKNTPIPFAPVMENFVIPDVADIVAGIRKVLS